ncbi:MAG: 3-deoxy-manno-octulosonate cytidylyltransferase [Phycisphaerae bacterium]|nr:3-deoxy-manno-octulosonate cytidylyltransferase [Phycisphaerae bacterium]
MSVVAVIPARLASTRFPRKALADATGLPLVVHACRQAGAASLVDRVLVAADGDEIIEAVEAHGFEGVRTDPDHPNGTSRIHEAMAGIDCDIVVNVQGDEPEIDPAHIDTAVNCLRAHDECSVATLAAPFTPLDDLEDENLVKVAIDEHGRAVDFSRKVIDRGELHRHVGLYVYRRTFLDIYVNLPPTGPEQEQRLEQLRITGHGYRVAVAVVEEGWAGIDTPEQYEAFAKRWNERSEH